jgi:ribosomal protein L11 methylase PrmA
MPAPVVGSFRDPSGYVYLLDGKVIRSVNKSYADDYTCAQDNGLFFFLRQEGKMVSFRETESPLVAGAWKTLETERIPVISYPYEWSFSQLKEAALLTLDIQREALKRDMVLKDASAFNVQFMSGKAIFIDVLSFERRRDNRPWCAYGQFCRHFVATLLLMSKLDLRCGLFLKEFIDGIPLEMASSLLSWVTYFSPNALLHIHIHAWMRKRHENNPQSAVRANDARLSKKAMLTLCEGLDAYVGKLSLPNVSTEWGSYYSDTNYSISAFRAKEEFVRRIIHEKLPAKVLDLGANDGRFSQIAAETAATVIAADIDPVAVDKHYRRLRKQKNDKNILPIVIDLMNPSPALGWGGNERDSFFGRCQAELVLALALVHHLAVSNNVPLPRIAEMLAALGKSLLIEFVPKTDSQAQRLLASRKDVFQDYHEEGFRNAFEKYFRIEECVDIPESQRKLFLMKRK